MPLAANVDGVRTIASFLSDDEWQRVRSQKPAISFACCEARGFPRVSKLGTRHFVHVRRQQTQACNWQPESPGHLHLKEVIAKACRAAGYTTDVEVSGTDWRADVMASRGRARIAFEIQLSRLTHCEMLERQRRYARDGVRGCWFYRVHRDRDGDALDNYRTNHELPAFGLSDDEIAVWFDYDHEEPVPIAEAVSMLLCGKIKFCENETSVPNRIIEFLRTTCYRCNRPTDFYFLHPPLSRCGHFMCSFDYDPLEEAACVRIGRFVRQLAEQMDFKVFVAMPRIRRAASSQREYVTFGCYWCDALLGREYILSLIPEPVGSRIEWSSAVRSLGKFEMPLVSLFRQRSPHWCVQYHEQFCSV